MKTISLKDANEIAAKIAAQVLTYKEQGFENISIKQVNDPNDVEELQEQILVDMTKDGENFEARLFAKEEDEKLVLKEKKNG